jgi:hypothetical protein
VQEGEEVREPYDAEEDLPWGWGEEDLLLLATVIGGKVERRELPPKNEHGQYILP